MASKIIMLLSENDGEGTVRHQDMVAKGVLPGKNKQTKWCLVALLLCFVDFLSVLFIVLYFLFFLTTHFFFSFFFFLFSFYSVDTIFKR